MDNFVIILDLLFYFFLYSIIGWILESVYKSILDRKMINSGFLYGPYCPIYGFGAVIMLLFLNKFQNNVFLLFLTSFIILTIWEYIVGVFLEKIYHTKYWDYSTYRFNIKGRVCLLNSFYWGILGVIFIKIAHPVIQNIVEKILIEWIIGLNIILFLIFLTDFVISNNKIKGIDKKLKRLKEITEIMKDKLEEIRTAKTEETKNDEFIQNLKEAFEELKIKQDILMIKLYKQGTRLKKAFPTIQSEKINEIFNKEIDLKSLKERIHKK